MPFSVTLLAIGRALARFRGQRTELFDKSRLICTKGSNTFPTGLKVYWELEVSKEYYPFPMVFIKHLVAVWLYSGR